MHKVFAMLCLAETLTVVGDCVESFGKVGCFVGVAYPQKAK